MVRRSTDGGHHVAFGISDDGRKAWDAYWDEKDVPSSGSMPSAYAWHFPPFWKPGVPKLKLG